MSIKKLNILYNLYLSLESKDKNKALIVKNIMLEIIPKLEEKTGCGLLYEGINI